MATTDNQRHLSDTTVLLPFGIPNPGRLAGPESVGKINLQLHSPFLYTFALSSGWLRFWLSLIAFALALIGAGSKKIGPIVF